MLEEIGDIVKEDCIENIIRFVDSIINQLIYDLMNGRNSNVSFNARFDVSYEFYLRLLCSYVFSI